MYKGLHWSYFTTFYRKLKALVLVRYISDTLVLDLSVKIKLSVLLFSSPLGGRVGRHPARIYSRWDMGNGIGLR
jgi:hypothetical protein